MNPTRDLDIIAEELRLKDIEFVEKALEAQKKKTRPGGNSLEQKNARDELATIEKILQWLQDGKDVRAGNWGPKEVRFEPLQSPKSACFLAPIPLYMMTKGHSA